jgi:hypothetical protein
MRMKDKLRLEVDRLTEQLLVIADLTGEDAMECIREALSDWLYCTGEVRMEAIQNPGDWFTNSLRTQRPGVGSPAFPFIGVEFN